MKEDIEFFINKAKVTLATNKDTFVLGNIAISVNFVENNNLAMQFATDGTAIHYNRKLLEAMLQQRGNKELEKFVTFAVAHEAMHIFLMHVFRGKRLHANPLLANLAMDAIINNTLTKDLQFPVIPNIVYEVVCPNCQQTLISEDEARDLSFEEGYFRLANHPCFKQGGQGQGQDNQQGNQNQGQGQFDEWLEPTASNETDLSEKENQVRRIVESAVSQAKLRGNMPAGLEKFYEELHKPILDWREILQNFLTEILSSEVSFRKPSRKSFVVESYLPSFVKSEGCNVLISIDTSGSIGDEEYIDFISEVKGLIESLELSGQIVMHDTEITKTISLEEIDMDEIMEELRKRKGFGGTSHSCVFKFYKELEEKPSVIVSLTDGFTEFNGNEVPEIPIIFVVTDSGGIKEVENLVKGIDNIIIVPYNRKHEGEN